MADEGLGYWRHNVWELQLDRCPCDADFSDYLKTCGDGSPSRRAIFHFGTGVHHLVGRRNAAQRHPDQILAITASPKELQSYVELLSVDPAIGASYKVLLADIYALSADMLPRFDLVTLFHLCEYYGPENARYAPLDDRSLLDLFLARLRPGGRILFYRGSNGYGSALPLLEKAVDDGQMIHLEDFRSLTVYTPRPASGASR